jgi:hypothetical protein
MTTEDGKERKKPRREHGPQGTHVFSREKVDSLIAKAESGEKLDAPVRLKGLSVEVKGRTFPLTGGRCVIGRADTCDLSLTDSSVSSEHARLSEDGQGWRVANLLSTNGTFINGKRISNERIQHGDRLRLGRVEFVFECKSASSSASAPSASPGESRQRWMLWVAGAAVAAAVIALIVLL